MPSPASNPTVPSRDRSRPARAGGTGCSQALAIPLRGGREGWGRQSVPRRRARQTARRGSPRPSQRPRGGISSVLPSLRRSCSCRAQGRLAGHRDGGALGRRPRLPSTRPGYRSPQLLPAPFAPMKTLIWPSSTLTSFRDLKSLTVTVARCPPYPTPSRGARPRVRADGSRCVSSSCVRSRSRPRVTADRCPCSVAEDATSEEIPADRRDAARRKNSFCPAALLLLERPET